MVVLEENALECEEEQNRAENTHRRNLAVLEGRNDSVDLELSVDIGLLRLDVCRFVDIWGSGHDGQKCMGYLVIKSLCHGKV